MSVMLSRVADSLYWMSRYLERAEHTARLLDVTFNLMLDESPNFVGRRRSRLLASLDMSAALPPDDKGLTELLTFDTAQSSSIYSCLAAARHNAQHVREQISSEMWEQINRLYLAVQRSHLEDVWTGMQTHEYFRRIKEGVHLFQGITDSTLSHGEGWQFIQVGRFVERARATALLLDVHYTDIFKVRQGMETSEFLEWVGLLKFCTAYEAYCKVYTLELSSDRIMEFLLLDTEFPRSIGYSAQMIHRAVEAIAALTDSRKHNRAVSAAGRFASTLAYTPVSEVTGNLKGFLGSIRQQCWDIHLGLFDRYIDYPVAAALSA